MNIAEIRAKYPQYSDVSDADLTNALHAKHYSDMPLDEFRAKIGFKPEVKVGAAGLPDAIRDVAGQTGPLSKLAIGAAGAVNSAAMRLKQLLGRDLTPQDVQSLDEYKALSDASGEAVAGDVLMSILGTAKLGGNIYSATSGAAARVLPRAAAVLAPTAGAAASGAALTTLTTPTREGESGAENAGIGAAASVAADTLLRGAGRVVRPLTQRSGNTQALMDEGIVPTVGQGAGANSFVGRIEQRLESLPLVGDVIRNARQRPVEELNVAAIRRALPLNEQGRVTASGRESVQRAQEILSTGYDDVLTRVTARPDLDFYRAVLTARNDPDIALPRELQTRLLDIVREGVTTRTRNGTMSGDLAKRFDSRLGAMARRYAGSNDGDQRAFALALRDVQGAFRDLMERGATGADADLLRGLNRNYANLLRVERAASYVGAEGGTFNASQLQSAVRALDSSRNHRQFAQGRALMQDLSDPAYAALRDTVRNSGTTDRALLAWAASHPLQAVGLGAAAIPTAALYSRPGQRYMQGDYVWQRLLGSGLRDAARYSGSAGPVVE